MANVIQFPNPTNAARSDPERREAGGGARFEYDPEAFEALAAYLAEREKPTQNAEGVHVGDLFYVMWGYEQTNVNYFQVVALKGAHTAVLREIERDYIGGFSFSGYVRPVRDHFRGEETYTLRTRKSRYYQDGRVEINAPRDFGRHHYLRATTDFQTQDYSSYA